MPKALSPHPSHSSTISHASVSYSRTPYLDTTQSIPSHAVASVPTRMLQNVLAPAFVSVLTQITSSPSDAPKVATQPDSVVNNKEILKKNETGAIKIAQATLRKKKEEHMLEKEQQKLSKRKSEKRAMKRELARLAAKEKATQGHLLARKLKADSLPLVTKPVNMITGKMEEYQKISEDKSEKPSNLLEQQDVTNKQITSFSPMPAVSPTSLSFLHQAARMAHKRAKTILPALDQKSNAPSHQHANHARDFDELWSINSSKNSTSIASPIQTNASTVKLFLDLLNEVKGN